MFSRSAALFALSAGLCLVGPALLLLLSPSFSVTHSHTHSYVWSDTLVDLWLLSILINATAVVLVDHCHTHSRVGVMSVGQVVSVVFVVVKGVYMSERVSDGVSGTWWACYVYLCCLTVVPSSGYIAMCVSEWGSEGGSVEEDHHKRLLGEKEKEDSGVSEEEGEDGGVCVSEGVSEGVDGDEERDKKEHASFRRLVSLVKPEIVTMCYATVALVVSVTCSLAQPFFFGKIIDACSDSDSDEDANSPQEQRHKLNGYIITLFVIFIVGGFFTFIRGWLYTLIGERLVARLRKDLFEHIIRQDIQFFDQNKTGELMNRLASDTTVIQSCLSVNVSLGLRSAMQILISLILLFVTSWKLTLVMISVIPVLIVFVRIYGKYTKKLTKAYQDALGRAADTGSESIASSRVVKSFASEDYECERYFKDITLSYEAGAKKARAYGGFSGAMFFVANTVILVVVYYGAVLVIQGSMTVGNLTTFIFYTIYIAIYLGVLSGLYTDFMNAVGASERIFQILDTVPRINTNGGVYPEENKKSADVDVTEDSENILNEIVSKKNMAGHIMFDNISFSYPTRPDIQVLDSFSLEVKPCQTVAIVGSSGSGKSTVFSLLERFYEVQQNSEGQHGSIFLDGVDIRNLDPRYLHTVVSIVPQEPTLFSGTIFSNIIYSSLARDPLGTTVSPSLDSVIDAAKQANAHDFIMKFPEQYDTLVGERGVRLSGGQKQRIAIARALIAAPKVLLLDEATSALDSESEQLVQEAIENLMSSSSTAAPDRSRSKGITVMIIAHRLSTVRDADQIVMLGRPVRRELNVDVEVEESVLGTSKEYETGSSIIDVGTHDELLSRCKEYRNLVQRQLSQKKPSDSSVSEQGYSSSDDQKCNPIDNDDD